MFGFIRRWFSGTMKAWKVVSTTLNSIEAEEDTFSGPGKGPEKKLRAMHMIRKVLNVSTEEWLAIQKAVDHLIDAAVELYNALNIFKK